MFKRNNKKVIIAFGIIFIFAIITVFNFFNTSPKAAIRRFLFTQGHPIIAIISPITKDTVHDKMDKRYYEKDIQYSYSFYSLLIPVEGEMGNFLFNFIVKKNETSYEVEYYGEA